MSEEEKRLLLFDETPEYLAMSKSEQKIFFKEAVKKISPQQMQKRIQLKIKNQGRAVTDFKQMKNMQTMIENKNDSVLQKRNEKQLEQARQNRSNVNNNNSNVNNNSNSKVLNLPEKKKIDKSGKYDGKTLASGYIEGKAGAAKRKATRKNNKNAELLNFIEESDNIKQKKSEEEEEGEEEEWKKNAREQKKIRESNKKLKVATENLKRTYYGYHNLNKNKNEDIEKSNDFTKNKSFDGSNLFDNENMHGRKMNINPPLQNKKLTLEEPGVVNFSSLLHEMQRNAVMSDPITNNINFRRLGGLKSSDTNQIVMPNSEVIKVFGWHETRLNQYKDALEFLDKKFEEMVNYTMFLEKRIYKLENDTVYTDYNTLLDRDNSIRKIQSTWRWYKFRRSVNAIFIQRWFRYKKNVVEVSDDVQKFLLNFRAMQEEAKNMEDYLLSLNSAKALPLNKLKQIKNKMKNRLTKVQNMRMI